MFSIYLDKVHLQYSINQPSRLPQGLLNRWLDQMDFISLYFGTLHLKFMLS